MPHHYNKGQKPSAETEIDFVLIENDEQLQAFADANQGIEWLGFDTEFVGEKRFYTLLCLIQIITKNGLYLIDPAKVKNLNPFLQFIEDEKVMKITHAGDNDYRVLNVQFGTIPKNVFDTQIAIGFISNTYPMSFQKLVERELGVKIGKGFTVTDWDRRPFNKKQLRYALNDVIYLQKLYQKISAQLNKRNRYSWAKEEMEKLEQAESYKQDPYKEALTGNFITTLSNQREQIFLLRLYAWRRAEAERRDISKEMALPAKYISVIVKNINEGKEALVHNRLIPDKLLNTHWDMFNELFQRKMNEEEALLLEQVQRVADESPQQALTTEVLHLLIKYKCLDEQVANSLVLSKSNLRSNAEGQKYLEEVLFNGWRRELLGDLLLEWIQKHNNLSISLEDKQCVIKML